MNRALPPPAPRRRGAAAVARAAEGDSGASPPAGMSTEEALNILGVSASAGFDEVMDRKKALLAQAGGDEDRVLDVENAYDVILSQRLKMRMTGENVAGGVRFADVPKVRPVAKANKSSPKQLSMPGGVSVQLSAPRQELAVQQGAIFGALAFWSILQVCFEDPAKQLSDTAGLQLTLGLAYSIYTLKENKGMGIGKAVGLSFAVLIAGALLGTLVHNWVRVDIVPIGSFGSPGVFCTEFVLVGMLLGALFLA